MSTKHIRNAADLARFNAGLRIECVSCGNCTTMDGFTAAKAFGTGSLSAVAPRLKCSRCGAKEAKLSVLSPPQPP